MAPILTPAVTAPLVYHVPEGAQPPAYLNEPGFRLATKIPAEGPDGAPGRLVSPLRDPGSLEVLPAGSGQAWFPIDGNVKMGIFQSLEKPAVLPAQLARAAQRSGHLVTLGDGQQWLIPVARLAMGGCGLPKRRKLNPDGSVVWQVEAQFAALSEHANRCWDYRSGLPVMITDEDLDRFAGEALSVNYRIGTREAIALGLLTDQAHAAIVDALLDVQTIDQIVQAHEKKG